VKRSGTPGKIRIYRASPRMRATAIGSISMMMKWRITKSCRSLRGLDVRLRNIPGVPPSAPPQAIFCRPHPRA